LKRRARHRRAPRVETTSAARLSSPAPRLTDDEIELCAQEWERSQAHLGHLDAMAESIWALDWADRLLAEIRRLRKELA
jgi:hypothetical protein